MLDQSKAANVSPAASDEADGRTLAVIPCLNERAHIGGLIAHILDDPEWDDPLLVVADGGSTDGSVELVRAIAADDPRVRLIHNPARIQSAGVNLAAALYGDQRRWLVRIDAHARYPANYVSGLAAKARRTGAQSVVVSMTCEGTSCFQIAAATAQNSVLGAGGSAHRSDGRAKYVDHGHHALMAIDRFDALGGYDETFSHNEDAELDLRLVRSGGRIWLTRDLVVTYFPRSTPGALFRQYLNHGRGRAQTICKHRARPKLRQLAPAAVGPAVVLAAFAPFAPVLAAPAALWLSATLLFGLAIGVREQQPCAAGAGVAAAIMHLGWSIGFWRGLLIGAPAGSRTHGAPDARTA